MTDPSVQQYHDSRYPCQPIKPRDQDCCGNGCSTCVFDLYELELSRWRQKCQRIDDENDGGKEERNEEEEIISIYEYRSFSLIEIMDRSPILYFTFEIPNNKKLAMSCGQHLVAR